MNVSARNILLAIVALAAIAIAAFLAFPRRAAEHTGEQGLRVATVPAEEIAVPLEEAPRVASHVDTPESVKAVYLSSWAASTNSFREKIFALAEETEINAVVIDVKDYTGKIAFTVNDPYLASIGSAENRIRDIDGLLEELHARGVYVIGRVAVFQDPYYVKKYPAEAVKRASDTSIVWTDRKKIPWIDAGSEEAWKYAVAIAREAHGRGFDEINFDYIRYPSDGNMKDISFPRTGDAPKPDTLKRFFAHLDAELRTEGIPISADLFGMTTSVHDDMNIGQILEHGLEHFDFVAPMVYPSHYPSGWNGYANPAAKPYDVIYKAMGDGYQRAVAMGEDPRKLRPWLQDFNLGATYTPSMVRAQIQATYDVGLDSWMLWDPANTYTRSALEE